MNQGFVGWSQSGRTLPQFKFIRLARTGNKTTNSASYAAIDATNLPPLSLPLEVGDVVRCTLAGYGVAGSGTGAQFDFQVIPPYGTTVMLASPATTGVTSISTTAPVPLAAIGFYTALVAGVHTFQPFWSSVNSGLTVTLYNTNSLSIDPLIQFSVENLGQPAP